MDDDLSIRDALTLLIESYGFEAVAFPGASAFLADPRRDAVSCVVTDVQMPDMNGLALQAELARFAPRLPVIFVTSFPDPDAREWALSEGAVAYLGKPVDPAELARHLETAVALRP